MTEGLSMRNPNEGKKKYSIVHWQTGKPKEEGSYLVTTNFGHVTSDNWMKKYNDGGSYYDWNLHNGNEEVRGWCKLSDIKPCKEEDDGIIPF